MGHSQKEKYTKYLTGNKLLYNTQEASLVPEGCVTIIFWKNYKLTIFDAIIVIDHLASSKNKCQTIFHLQSN